MTSAESDRAHDDDAWEPDWISGYFFGKLVCNNDECAESVVVTGSMQNEILRDELERWDGLSWDYHLQLRFAIPALRVVEVPERCPKTVMDALEGASAVIWTDPSAAANRLRTAIDELLTAQKVNKFSIARGRRSRLTTHARVLLFAKKNNVASTALEAVKWIGNQGSHQSRLSILEVLEGAELFEFALREIYDDSRIRMTSRAKEINKAKGIRRTRN